MKKKMETVPALQSYQCRSYMQEEGGYASRTQHWRTRLDAERRFG